MTTLVVKNRPMKGQMFAYEPATVTFTGELQLNPEWVADDCVTITGDDFTPIRIIRKVDIVSGLEVEKIPVPPADQIFEVVGSKGDNYKVAFREGNWFCTCKGFQYRSACRHINEVKNELIGKA
jgi:hypothetical protein